ncbi:hypothetical protein [Sphingomonas sp. 3-13AW]|uniref:hypothetical protein n=1 Tax=Sphingomonas sp. 3-13AW TaxID=3050450 RepID=UPI003BB5495F
MDPAVAPTQYRPQHVSRDNSLRRSAIEVLTKAIASAVESASDATLEAIVGAGDPAQALAVAPRDLAPAPPERLAAERAAKARTAHFRTELAEKAGGMFTRADVAELLSVTPAAVDKQRQRGQILGVPYGNEVRFPAAQFANGAVVPGLKPILAAFGDMNPWGQLQLLVAPLSGFGEEPASILDLLAQGAGQDVQEQLIRLIRGWAR